MKSANLLTCLLLSLPLSPLAYSQGPGTVGQASFSATEVLSDETAGGYTPGGVASKGKLLRLTATPMGSQDGRLVTIYGDAANDTLIWEPKGGEHAPRDIFVRYSDDNGVSWSTPLNISNTANHHSAMTDWNGDGIDEIYWGDSEKPNVFSSGSTVVVSWVDAYSPEASATWGSDATSSVQGSVAYADADVYPNTRVVPFKTVYAAISYDGGSTWAYGEAEPAIQMTYGRRDAKQDVHRGSGKRWVMTWQEDPMGLQQGGADGPGTGASGAKVTKGTDIWYTYVEDITSNPLGLRDHRLPLSNQSEYDLTQSNGFTLNPINGGSGSGSGSNPNHPDAGSIENHGCSRANLNMINMGNNVFHAIVAYEETKGVPLIEEGKTVQYHSFPYNAPVRNGDLTHSYGVPEAKLSPQQMNSRRVRFVVQGLAAPGPAIALIWKQGRTTSGGPSDIMCRVSESPLEADVLAATSVNLSTATPNATNADLLLDSEVNPIEDANAHRGILRNGMLVIGWGYTWNGPLARYTDLANYNFWIRRSLDGGVTWGSPQNVSNITDTTITMREPRLVGPARVPGADLNSIVTAWGTETNVYDGIEDPESLDTFLTYSRDQGATFSPVVPLSAGVPRGEFETQIRMNDAADEIYAVVMSKDAGNQEALFTRSTEVFAAETLGTIVCFGDGTGANCPCGNDSPSNVGAGCANSTGSGALLVGTGSASVGQDDLSFTISGLPSNAFMVLTQGPNYAFESTGAFSGDGLLCIGAPLIRMSIYAANGSGVANAGPGIASQASVQAGESRLFQVFYRDHGGPCGTGFSVTNAVQIQFED